MRTRTALSPLALALVAACSSNAPPSSTLEATSDVAVASSLTAAPGAPERQARDDDDDDRDAHRRGRRVKHVLLLSIDGLHAVDLSRFIDGHPRSALARLAHHGVRYDSAYVNRLDGTPSNPSDSFPGLLALTTGGSSPTHGSWYDVSYARDVHAYSATAPCAGPPGTTVAYDETLDVDGSHLWGNSADDTPTHDVAVVRSRIDRTHLPYAMKGGSCEPVFPHQFIRTNTIFNVARAAGLHTAWSDKHLAYELVSGPSGTGLDDLFAPEINSDPSNSLIPSAPKGSAFTDRWTYTEAYDDLKAQAILNEIDGEWSDHGLAGARESERRPGVPSIFGMNFQALSVAQKNAKPTGGYEGADGTPGPEVLDALEHTDASIARMLDRLDARGLRRETLIVVTAKHGQSPIDRTLYTPVDGDAVAAAVDAVAPVAGHVEDDAAFYWLRDPKGARAAASFLLAPPAGVDARADLVLTTSTDSAYVRMFGDPARDPRAPDVVVQPARGVLYSLSKKKDAEHGGFTEDDAHVGLLVSNPALDEATVLAPVRTKQVAPTILRALGLDPRALDAVRAEGTRALPELDL
jgi:predicted AlkP superfamily pyrophosphatase or phosphodiesterase